MVMDSARCICPPDGDGKRACDLPSCPIHGAVTKWPLVPYRLSENDRKMLRSFRIATTDTTDIQDVRQADEDRFKRE